MVAPGDVTVAPKTVAPKAVTHRFVQSCIESVVRINGIRVSCVMPIRPRNEILSAAPPAYHLITTVTYRRHGLLASTNLSGSRLSPIGEIVAAAWELIPTHRPWISLGLSVVMPDHFHGILHWTEVPPGRAGSLSRVVGGFKAEATRLARASGHLGQEERLWQKGFDVRFLTTPRRLAMAEGYIRGNPFRSGRPF